MSEKPRNTLIFLYSSYNVPIISYNFPIEKSPICFALWSQVVYFGAPGTERWQRTINLASVVGQGVVGRLRRLGRPNTICSNAQVMSTVAAQAKENYEGKL